MKRILIIGSPGSGKSTLSRILKEKLKINVVHLDTLYWKPNWINVDNEIFDKLLTRELTKDEWIIEGNYNRTLPYRLKFADTIIYLDYDTEVCLSSWKNRVKEGILKSDMPEDCVEAYDVDFENYIINFKKDIKPKIELALKNFNGNVLVFKNRETAKNYINTL